MKYWRVVIQGKEEQSALFFKAGIVERVSIHEILIDYRFQIDTVFDIIDIISSDKSLKRRNKEDFY